MDTDPRLAEVIGAGQKLGAEISQEFKLIEGKPMAILTIHSKEIMFPQPIDVDKMVATLEAEEGRHEGSILEIRGKIKELHKLKEKQEKQAKDK